MSESDSRVFKRYLNSKEAAEFMNINERWLRNNRQKGPKFIKLSEGRSGKILYDRDDIISFMDGMKGEQTDENNL